MLQPISKIFHTVCTGVISCIQGTALHFVLVAAFLRNTESFPVFLSGSLQSLLFCPVNESVWEHLKLLYFPFLFVSIWEYLSLHPVVLPFFYCRYLGVLLGMFLLFLFLHIFRDSRPEFPDLRHPAFYSSVIFSFGMSEYISQQDPFSLTRQEPGFVVSLWLITSFFFFVFTCFPPDLPLFYSA